MIEFNEKTLNKKQKLSVILSRDQYSLQKHRAYCYQPHIQQYTVKRQGLAGKFTVSPSNPRNQALI